MAAGSSAAPKAKDTEGRGAGDTGALRLGLRANWRQFWLLVAVNAFVGAMVGLERAVIPLLAEEEFGIASASATLSFIATFGGAKAVMNLVAGRLGDRVGRRPVLLAGWLVGLPVPFLIIVAQSWEQIVLANLLLGISQGLAWSTTVVMKIDLVGPSQRGLAMGLNEFAGYLAVALAALAGGEVAARFGLRPEPFYLGIAIAAGGLLLSLVFVRETASHVHHEAGTQAPHQTQVPRVSIPTLLSRSLWRDPVLFSTSQAGLVNNLNDGVAWGLFPLFFAAAGLSIREISFLAFVYPAVWGMSQLLTGMLSDKWGRRPFIIWGMLLQAVALGVIAMTQGMIPWALASALLGLGTAMVYPTLLAAVGDGAHPLTRGTSVGVYRLWRDLGYVAGALIAGVLADAVGMEGAIWAVAALTAMSGVAAALRLPETRRL